MSKNLQLEDRLRLRNLADFRYELRRFLHFSEGRAAEAGIQPGDVVLSVDGTPVQSVEQLRKMVQDHDKQIALLIQRGDARVFVPITLG